MLVLTKMANEKLVCLNALRIRAYFLNSAEMARGDERVLLIFISFLALCTNELLILIFDNFLILFYIFTLVLFYHPFNWLSVLFAYYFMAFMAISRLYLQDALVAEIDEVYKIFVVADIVYSPSVLFASLLIVKQEIRHLFFPFYYLLLGYFHLLLRIIENFIFDIFFPYIAKPH